MKIKFKTSFGTIKGYVVNDEETLEMLKGNDKYFCSDTKEFHCPPYNIFLTKMNPFVLVDKKSTNLLELNYNFVKLHYQNGWVKMELSVPYFGDPEWKIKKL